MKLLSIVLWVITIAYLLSAVRLLTVSVAFWINVVGCVALIPVAVHAQMEHRKMLRTVKEQHS